MVSQDEYVEICTKIGQLTDVQRSDLQARIKAFQALSREPTVKASRLKVSAFDDSDFSSTLEIMETAVVQAFARSGYLNVTPTMLRRNANYKIFKLVAAALHNEKPLRDVATNARRLLVLTMFELLMVQLKATGAPVTINTVLANSRKIKTVLDDAFPGYWQAGLLGMIIRTHKGATSARKKHRTE